MQIKNRKGNRVSQPNKTSSNRSASNSQDKTIVKLPPRFLSVLFIVIGVAFLKLMVILRLKVYYETQGAAGGNRDVQSPTKSNLMESFRPKSSLQSTSNATETIINDRRSKYNDNSKNNDNHDNMDNIISSTGMNTVSSGPFNITALLGDDTYVIGEMSRRNIVRSAQHQLKLTMIRQIMRGGHNKKNNNTIINQSNSVNTTRTIDDLLPLSLRYQPITHNFAGVAFDDHFAYLHIWKSGGTTMLEEAQQIQQKLLDDRENDANKEKRRKKKKAVVKHTNINNKKVQERYWFSFVRDPIDHFLSGWAECGYRKFKESSAFKTHNNMTLYNMSELDLWHQTESELNVSRSNIIQGSPSLQEELKALYNQRIEEYLIAVQQYANVLKRNNDNSNYEQRSCLTHSLPQGNFLFDQNGNIYEKLKIVGDMKEIPEVLDMMISVNDNNTGTRVRDNSVDKSNTKIYRKASDNPFKTKYFPQRKDLISNDLILKICEFVAIDYYLFHFEPPAVCADSIVSIGTVQL